MDVQSIGPVCQKALKWAKDRNYVGYGKFDALNSPGLRLLAGRNRYLRGGFTYLVSRAPVNLRPLFGVEKRQNPKSLGLFARSYFNFHTLTGDAIWLRQGLGLLERLLELSQIHGYSGHCWGAEHPRQSTQFYVEAHFPGAVITVEIAEAFLDAYEKTANRDYLDVARSAADFISQDLTIVENGATGLCYGYIPGSSWKIINANAKTACFLARLATIVGDQTQSSQARANMRWVVERQTKDGAWFYADPPRASHVAHDNYHTGFVLSSLLEYITVTNDEAWRDVYARGLDFYERELFLPSGAPKWRSDRIYPLDIHGAAQGILNFCLASSWYPSKLKVAKRIAEWALENMSHPDGRFYYQKGPWWTKRYTLMRWCQAWMCYALSTLALTMDSESW